MPSYLPYPSLAEADARSATWATHLGCGRNPADVTRYWYERRQRTGDPEADAGLPDGVNYAVVVRGRDEVLDGLLREDQMTADEIAALVSLYPAWQTGMAYSAGAIVAHNGQLYRLVQAHTSQPDWTPDATPALWEPCAPAGVIPAWTQPSGAHDAYPLGARVTHKGQVWESTVNTNVWEPGVFGWVVVSAPAEF